MSTAAMWALVAAYLLIAGMSAWERNWPRTGYFVCAAGILISTIAMQR